VAVVKLIKIDMKDFSQRTGPKFMMIALLANLLFIYTIYLLLKLLDGRDISTLGFSFTSKAAIISAFAALLTLFTAVSYIYGLVYLKKYQVRLASHCFIQKDESVAFILSFMVLFVAALQEEVMFRGYFSYILQRYNTITVMFLSTVIFTVWHFIGNKVNFYQAIDWFLGGLLLYYVYIKSGSIWVAAIVHFSRNLTNVILFNIANKHSLLQWNQSIKTNHKTLYTFICSLFIAFFTFVLY
jgi:membrane protease YdiL (CAAX protease family)